MGKHVSTLKGTSVFVRRFENSGLVDCVKATKFVRLSEKYRTNSVYPYDNGPVGPNFVAVGKKPKQGQLLMVKPKPGKSGELSDYLDNASWYRG